MSKPSQDTIQSQQTIHVNDEFFEVIKWIDPNNKRVRYHITDSEGIQHKGTTKIGRQVLKTFKQAQANQPFSEKPKAKPEPKPEPKELKPEQNQVKPDELIQQATEEKSPQDQPNHKEILEQNKDMFYTDEEAEEYRAFLGEEYEDEEPDPIDEELEESELESTQAEIEEMEEEGIIPSEDDEEAGGVDGLSSSDYAEIYADFYDEGKYTLWFWVFQRKIFTKAERERISEVQWSEGQLQKSDLDISIARKKGLHKDWMKDVKLSPGKKRIFSKIMSAMVRKHKWMRTGPEAMLATFIITDQAAHIRKVMK